MLIMTFLAIFFSLNKITLIHLLTIKKLNYEKIITIYF